MAASSEDEDEDDYFEDDEIGPFGTNGDNLEGLARRALSRLNNDDREEIDVSDYPELEELIMELSDSSTAYGSEFVHKLGFPPSLINKFLKFRGEVRTQVARKLTERLLTYMRSEESQGAAIQRVGQARPPLPADLPANFVVTAVEWKVIRRTDELEEKISEVARLLNDVTKHIATCNMPEGQRALSEVERAQLIAVLETVLHMLKGPMVEKGLMRKAGDMLKRAAAKAIEKQTEEAFAFAAGVAVGKLAHLGGIL